MTKEAEKKEATTKKTSTKESTNKATKTIQKQKTQQAPKPKQLTMAKVKREATQTNKTELFELNESDTIRHFPIFPRSKITEMLKEYQSQIQYATANEILLPEDKALDYIYFLCIKHFTSLEKGISDKYEDQLLQMDYLIDAGYYMQIINEVFMPSEINKVLDALTDFMSANQLLQDVDTQINQKTENLKLRNKDMLNVLADNPYTEVTDKH